MKVNTQVSRYLLSYKGGIFCTYALTSVALQFSKAPNFRHSFRFSLFQYQPNFDLTKKGLIIGRFKVFLCICIISDTYSTMNIITVYCLFNKR